MTHSFWQAVAPHILDKAPETPNELELHSVIHLLCSTMHATIAKGIMSGSF